MSIMRSSSHVQLALFYSRMRIPPTNVADVNYIRGRTTYSQNIPCILAILMTSLYNTKMNAYDAIKYGSAAYHIQTSEYKITQHGNAVVPIRVIMEVQGRSNPLRIQYANFRRWTTSYRPTINLLWSGDLSSPPNMRQ